MGSTMVDFDGVRVRTKVNPMQWPIGVNKAKAVDETAYRTALMQSPPITHAEAEQIQVQPEAPAEEKRSGLSAAIEADNKEEKSPAPAVNSQVATSATSESEEEEIIPNFMRKKK